MALVAANPAGKNNGQHMPHRPSGVDNAFDEPPVVRLLGSVEVTGDDGRTISLSPQAARLFALLAASGTSVSKSQIAEHVTGTTSDASAVRTAVSRLRSVVGSLVVRTDDGYRLDIAPNDSDIGRFRELLRVSSVSQGGARAGALRRAIELWRGNPFGAYSEEHWALARSVELRTLYSTAVEDLAEELLSSGDPGGAIAVLRPHLVEHTLEERPVALLMRALAADGRLAEALEEFQRLRQALDEIGLVPSGDLRRLEHDVLRTHERPETPEGNGPEQPAGRVSIVFTDVVDSTRLWASSAVAMSASLELHDRLLGQVFSDHRGYVFARLGDGIGLAFTNCEDAVRSAVAAQKALGAADWPGPRLHVRIGITVGEPELRDGIYFGDPVNLASRLTAAANGGQVIVSSAVREESSFEGRDLGEHHLREIMAPHHVWQVGADEHPPLQARSVLPVRIPQPRHELLGRADELEAVIRLMQESPLVTLTGAGGSGKTALAIVAAKTSAPSYPGGVYFVDLAPVESGADVLPAFAVATGTQASAGSIDRVVAALPYGAAIFVVDNCEHVLREVQEIVDRIVDRHGDVKVLATSREALQVDGERTLRVAPLDTSVGGPATALFFERAAAVRPNADLDDMNAVAKLCEQLDGMPLAIEMAAARRRSMSLDEILRRLDDRFRLLLGGTHRARRRQQTLEAVIAWSHDLLAANEQEFFRRLGVFSGDFDITAAAAVSDMDELTAANLIDSLLNKSLIDPVNTRGDSRYRLLESLRIFALDRLLEFDDPDDARDRHAAHYASRWNDPQTTTQEHRRQLADAQNMTAAFDWALEKGDAPQTVAKLVAMGGPIGALVERRWAAPGAGRLVRQITAVARSEPLREVPELLVPFVASSAIGSFASFTNDLELRSAVEDLDRLAWTTIDVMKRPDFRSPSPSCGLLLIHLSHHLLPERAGEAHRWAQQFTRSNDFSVRAMARFVVETALTFLDPSNPTIDPLRLLGDGIPEGPWINAIAANAAYLSVLTGRAEQAAGLLQSANNHATPGSISDLNRLVGHVATALAFGQVPDAMTMLVDQIEDVPFGVPGRESTYIAMCAWARHLIGDSIRAQHLIDQTVKRLPQDYLLTCHVKSIIDQWPIGDFHARSVEWHNTHSMSGDVVARIEAMPALLAEEITFWGRRRPHIQR